MSNSKSSDEKLGYLPFVISGLSFIPLCGVIFGIISIVWGLVTPKRGGKVLAIIGALGIAFTVILYGSLFYFGFIQRGGFYDEIRAEMAKSQLPDLVKAIEFYKLQNGKYPTNLDELANSQKQGQYVSILDPTTMVGISPKMRNFHYKVLTDGRGYYLLSVGTDGKPYTPDDLLPNIEAKNIGLQIHPNSKPK